MNSNQQQILIDKLRTRPSRGGVRLSYQEASYLAYRMETPLLTRETLAILVDQAKRTRLREAGTAHRAPGEQQHLKKPSPPVYTVRLSQRLDELTREGDLAA